MSATAVKPEPVVLNPLHLTTKDSACQDTWCVYHIMIVMQVLCDETVPLGLECSVVQYNGQFVFVMQDHWCMRQGMLHCFALKAVQKT